jgi:hypothetical protein
VTATRRTAPPFALTGRPAGRCHSPRGLALRVIPLRYQLDERAARRAYRSGGAHGLALHIRAELFAVVRGRAVNDDERRVLTTWLRTMTEEVTADALAYAESEGWTHAPLWDRVSEPVSA